MSTQVLTPKQPRRGVKRSIGNAVVESADTVSEAVSALRIGATIIKTALSTELLEMRVSQALDLLEDNLISEAQAQALREHALKDFMS